MRFLIPALIAFLVSPPQAFAAEDNPYPRVVRRPGQVCVQTQAADGTVKEACRLASGEWTGDEASPRRSPTPAEEIADFRPDPPRSVVPEPTAADPAGPADIARFDAEDAADGGGYLAGGVLGGCLLGVLGCGGLMVLGLASDPVPPHGGRFATEEDERLYRNTFRSEVRNTRARNAIIGGLIGMALLAAVIYAAASQGNST